MAHARPLPPPSGRRIAPPRRIITNVEELPLLCDCSDAGLLLRRSPESIAKMAKDGTLPGVKQGQTWYFRRQDLVDYLDSLFAACKRGVKGAEA